MRNKSTLTFYTFLLICCVSIISIEKTSAQENEIYELTDDINSPLKKPEARSTSKKTKIKKVEDNSRSKFYSLIKKMHTTAYIKNSAVTKIYGKGPIKKITFKDVKSFNLLNKKNEKYDHAELLTVSLKNVNDLNNYLNLSKAQGVNKLRYVFIKCHFKCTKKQIKKFVKTNSNSNIRIFYKTESASQ